MNLPVLTTDLAARIVQLENDVMRSRLQNIERIAGNPLGAAVREFGHVLATMMPRFPERWWNRVGGIAAGDEGLIDEIIAWYRAAGLSCAFEIVPPQSSDALLKALAARGFYQSGFRSILYGVPDSVPAPFAPGVAVKEQKELKLFFDLAIETGFLNQEWISWEEYARAQFLESRCYVAYVDGQPAAHAMMKTSDRAAMFGFGATLEAFRGRGCQLALLRARLVDAAKAGCDLAIVQANPGSVSQRNIERAGMRVAYTKVIWSEPSNSNGTV